MQVAVLGGGLQGCCTALALAERGIAVVLIDRNARLLSRTAVANEGKIHLGYMYAADSSFATARMMLKGALTFAPFMSRHLGIAPDRLSLSRPATYVVHRDSQHDADWIGAYLGRTHELIENAARDGPAAYFGIDLRQAPRRHSQAELGASFDPGQTLAAFDTVEVAIDPEALAATLLTRIAADPRIETRLETEVVGGRIEEDGVVVQSRKNGGGTRDERFDQAVNA